MRTRKQTSTTSLVILSQVSLLHYINILGENVFRHYICQNHIARNNRHTFQTQFLEKFGRRHALFSHFVGVRTMIEIALAYLHNKVGLCPIGLAACYPPAHCSSFFGSIMRTEIFCSSLMFISVMSLSGPTRFSLLDFTDDNCTQACPA